MDLIQRLSCVKKNTHESAVIRMCRFVSYNIDGFVISAIERHEKSVHAKRSRARWVRVGRDHVRNGRGMTSP